MITIGIILILGSFMCFLVEVVEHNTGYALIAIFLLLFAFLCFNDEIEEKAIERYLNHPEQFEIQYVYNQGDSIPSDTLVHIK